MSNYWGISHPTVVANYEWLSKDLYEVYVEVEGIEHALEWDLVQIEVQNYWRKVAGKLADRGH